MFIIAAMKMNNLQVHSCFPKLKFRYVATGDVPTVRVVRENGDKTTCLVAQEDLTSISHGSYADIKTN